MKTPQQQKEYKADTNSEGLSLIEREYIKAGGESEEKRDKMNEEEVIDEMIEDTLSATMEAVNVAIASGDYKKVNELLDILTVKKSEKIKEDIMVA